MNNEKSMFAAEKSIFPSEKTILNSKKVAIPSHLQYLNSCQLCINSLESIYSFHYSYMIYL